MPGVCDWGVYVLEGKCSGGYMSGGKCPGVHVRGVGGGGGGLSCHHPGYQ